MSFPLSILNERRFEAGWSGEVFVCDVDRTYLNTRFSSLKGLAQIPFEFAVDKHDIEGMAALLREVRRGPRQMSRQTPLYFVSASPAQLRPVVQRKMMMDGLEFDGTLFKDWLGVLRSLRLGRLKEQLGFKLTALLRLRQLLPDGAQLVLVGDDLELDPLAFVLLADATAGRLSGRRLEQTLSRHGVRPQDIEGIAALLDQVPRTETVKRAYIRMERHADAEAFLDYWPHVAPCRGALQMALGLCADGSLSPAGVGRVVRALRERKVTPERLRQRVEEAARHGLLSVQAAAELRPLLDEAGLWPEAQPLPAVEPQWAAATGGGDWTPGGQLGGGAAG